MRRRDGTAGPIKRSLNRIAISDPVGWVFARCSGGYLRYRGCVLEVPVSRVSLRVVAAIALGRHEAAEARLAFRWLTTSANVVELGAGCGAVSAVVARRKRGNSYRHLVVEPSAELLPVINGNIIRNNSLAKPFVVHGFVCTSTSRSIEVDNSPCVKAAKVWTPAATEQLGARRFDGFGLEVLLGSAGIDSFELVMDVEGGEAALLLETPTILRNCTRLVAELHTLFWEGKRYSPDELVGALEGPCGFEIVERQGDVVAGIRKEQLNPG